MISKNKVLNFVTYEIYKSETLNTIPLYRSSIDMILEEKLFGYYVLSADDHRVLVGDKIINMISGILYNIVDISNNKVKLMNNSLYSKTYFNDSTTIDTILNYSRSHT